MIELEQYEWCDFWWQEAAQQDKKRVLLVGDSITKAYRPYVNEQLNGRFFADQLATSKGVDNPAFLIELDYMLQQKEYHYQAIHLNNGLHGMHLSREQYEIDLEKVIQHILSRISHTNLILGLTTPVTKTNITDEINAEVNNIVLDRNHVMRRLAQKYNLMINDLYTPMLGKSEYRVDDGYHYNELGQRVQSEIVVGIILSMV